MHFNLRSSAFICGAMFLISSCDKCNQSNPPVVEPVKEIVVNAPPFSSDSAYDYVKAQVDFGPRNMNSKGHEACSKWLIGKAQQFADTVYTQKFDATGYDGATLKCTNIIASFNPQATTRVLLCTHWDTRPWADEDSKDSDKPILGANDGASGPGILLEIARVLKSSPVKIGVDLFFIDAEDYGKSGYENSYCLGSQHWAQHPHVNGYRADFGILLDMAGARNAVFAREQNSSFNAAWVQDKVWANAVKLGHGSFFSNQQISGITDDHVYINNIIKIPTIDIIHHDPNSPSGTFFQHWHTHGDNMDAIDKTTLNAVGRTLLYTIYQYEAEQQVQ